MGLCYEQVGDRAELTIAGEVTVEEIVACLETGASPGEARPTRLLINVADSMLLPRSVQLRRIAEAIAAHQGDRCGPVAVYVTRRVRYGLARQLGVFLESVGITLRPFTDRDEAVAWLDSG